MSPRGQLQFYRRLADAHDVGLRLTGAARNRHQRNKDKPEPRSHAPQITPHQPGHDGRTCAPGRNVGRHAERSGPSPTTGACLRGCIRAAGVEAGRTQADVAEAAGLPVHTHCRAPSKAHGVPASAKPLPSLRRSAGRWTSWCRCRPQRGSSHRRWAGHGALIDPPSQSELLVGLRSLCSVCAGGFLYASCFLNRGAAVAMTASMVAFAGPAVAARDYANCDASHRDYKAWPLISASLQVAAPWR